MVDAASDPIEVIPDEDTVSRPFFKIPSDIDPRSALRFDYDRVRDESALSVVWRKYAPSTQEVHSCGCAVAVEASEGNRRKGGAPAEYGGFRSAQVASVRAIKSQRGNGLEVLHVPVPGKRWHAHISVVATPGQRTKNISKTVRGELRELLYAALGPYEPYGGPR